jgi:hypothetical protein
MIGGFDRLVDMGGDRTGTGREFWRGGVPTSDDVVRSVEERRLVGL